MLIVATVVGNLKLNNMWFRNPSLILVLYKRVNEGKHCGRRLGVGTLSALTRCGSPLDRVLGRESGMIVCRRMRFTLQSMAWLPTHEPRFLEIIRTKGTQE